MDRLKVLGKAAETMEERGKNYGTPSQNFTNIAKLWSVTLGVEVTPLQVAMCMCHLKLARLAATEDHHDSWLDVLCYAALAVEVSDD